MTTINPIFLPMMTKAHLYITCNYPMVFKLAFIHYKKEHQKQEMAIRTTRTRNNSVKTFWDLQASHHLATFLQCYTKLVRTCSSISSMTLDFGFCTASQGSLGPPLIAPICSPTIIIRSKRCQNTQPYASITTRFHNLLGTIAKTCPGYLSHFSSFPNRWPLKIDMKLATSGNSTTPKLAE